jgi:thiosulfate dehydrogenase
MSALSRFGRRIKATQDGAERKAISLTRFIFVLIPLVLIFFIAMNVSAQVELPSDDDLILGALIYDRWYAVLDLDPPSHENPLWNRQSTNSRTGLDTWRCVECHGWDYKGADGAYGYGSHYTGFPNVKQLSEQLSMEEIIDHLQGGKDPAHDFSTYIPEVQLRNVALFLKYGLVDDDLYIDDVSLKVIAGDVTHGQELFELVCSQCHGEDGQAIIFREEGVDEFLGTVANRDPWRFLHRTRFGTAGTSMPIGHAFGWSPEDGRDVLAYAQTLPTGLEEVPQSQAGESAEPVTDLGGPAQNFWQGILTGLATFIGIFGASILFLSALVGIGVLVVIVLRRR